MKRTFVYHAVKKDGGSLYLAQLWFNPNGDLIGKHRKMRASVAERLIWGMEVEV
ncbi:hypothetical protein BsIDN1_41740 [Bacillus safensis]|uniref:Uncharacterized protein n=1 Tax=Bacillus safensis TaxID=561879 RepID=A0A5S9MG31_BACIA|nr:hypothetical protein BsIDN1_41740 [Bacillus safensis]